jgi:hypothetical protein
MNGNYFLKVLRNKSELLFHIKGKKYILGNFKLRCKKQEYKSSFKESRDFNINTYGTQIMGKITTN